jgi:hypothetical protein
LPRQTVAGIEVGGFKVALHSNFVFWIYAGGNAEFMESDSFAAASGVARSIDAGVLLNGTCLIRANGSGTASVNGSGTTPLRVQMINPGEAVFISADPSQPLIGLVEKQCSNCH